MTNTPKRDETSLDFLEAKYPETLTPAQRAFWRVREMCLRRIASRHAFWQKVAEDVTEPDHYRHDSAVRTQELLSLYQSVLRLDAADTEADPAAVVRENNALRRRNERLVRRHADHCQELAAAHAEADRARNSAATVSAMLKTVKQEAEVMAGGGGFWRWFATHPAVPQSFPTRTV